MANRLLRGGCCVCLITMRVLGQAQGRPVEKSTEPQDGKGFVFGTTVVSTTGLTGQIYYLPKDTQILPNFKKLKPKGKIYTTRLNIPPRNFTEGFPGVTDRFEWFAILYTGKIWVERPGRYEFALTSDDGSKLHVDDKMIVYNDGVHPPVTERGEVKLTQGVHTIRVAYFQGPRTTVALVLAVAKPGEKWRLFDTNEFLPPPDKFDQFTSAEAEPQTGKKKPRR